MFGIWKCAETFLEVRFPWLQGFQELWNKDAGQSTHDTLNTEVYRTYIELGRDLGFKMCQDFRFQHISNKLYKISGELRTPKTTHMNMDLYAWRTCGFALLLCFISATILVVFCVSQCHLTCHLLTKIQYNVA